MKKNTGNVREICQSENVGTMYPADVMNFFAMRRDILKRNR